MYYLLQTAIIILSVFILVAIKMPIILVLLIPIIIIGVMTRVYYMKTARELRRIESVGKLQQFMRSELPVGIFRFFTQAVINLKSGGGFFEKNLVRGVFGQKGQTCTKIELFQVL